MSEMPTAQNSLLYQHQQWLQHPITKELINILKNYSNHLSDKLVAECFTNNDTLIAKYACSVKSVDTIILFVTETEIFVKQTTNK